MSKYEFDGEKVKKLYGAMQKLGYQQSLGEFEKGFYGRDNYQKRKAVYDAMTEAGADLGSSYEDFMGRMRATSSSGGVSKSATKPTNKAPNTHISEQPWAQKSKEAKRAAAVLDSGFDALTRAVEVSSDENFRKIVPNKLASERVEDPKSKRLVTKPKKYSVPESDVREGGSMVRMVDAYKTVDGKAVSIPSDATSTQGNENQDEDFATQYISGEINREEYKKKAKAKDNEAAIDNSQPTMESDEEFLYRTDKRYREYRDKIINGDGDVDELSPETKAWYLQRVEARIKDAEERQKKYADEIEKNYDHAVDSNSARGFMPMGARTASNMRPEVVLNQAAADKVEDELTDLYNVRDMLKGKDVGFFRKFGEFFSKPKNYTFGLAELNNNVNVLTHEDHRLVPEVAKAYAKADEAGTMYSRSANLRAKAGSVTAEMVPFIVEIAASGGLSSAASKGVRGLVHAGGKAVMKSAFKKGVERSLMKSLGAGAVRWGTRGIEWVAGATAAGAVVATTTGAGETAANITGRMVGHGTQQEDGSYAFEGGEGAVGAILHGFTSQLVENATEFMGGGLGYGVGKVASKLTKPLAKVGLGGVTDFFGRIAASPISKATSKTLSKFQIQGIPEEIGEEYLGWAGHSMAGDGDAEWSDFADFQKHKELWATMALSVGAMGAFAASGHVPSLLKRRGRSLKMADRAAAGAFSDEEKWNALRDKLDGTDNDNVLRSLYDNVMQDKSLNGRERKAAMLYAGNLLVYRGANLGAIAGKRLALEQKRSDAEDARRAALVEGAAPSGAESVDEHELDGDDVVSSAFRQGYEETSAANAYLWAKALEEQEGHAMESLGLAEKELNEKFSPQNAGRTLNEIRGAKEGTYTEEQKKAAFDYANTRAAYEGVVERTQDDIDSEIAYHHAIVDRQTNIDFGQIHPVKLFTSEKYKWDDAFLVSGRLGFEYDDMGKPVVSERESDPTLVISDAAGRTRMVSPSEIADAGFPIDVDEYKNTLAEHVRQEMEERKYAEMLKAAEEAQANEVEEGEPESPAVDGVSTSEEENGTPEVSENGEQSSVFSGAFNVGDKFSTADGEFEVVQLTEGEAPIVQNVETGQQFRPNSEEELRAAILSYIPAFIDGKENTNTLISYWRLWQSPVAPQNEAQEGSQQEQEEVAPKPNEAQQDDGTTSENDSVGEEQEGFTEDSDSSSSDSQSENTQEESTISLEEVQSALDKGEIEGVTPQMAHDALYGDPDLETEEVDAIVENSRSTAQANLAKLQKTEIKPRKNESVISFKQRKAAYIDALAHAEELVRFWEEVQEHRRNLGAQAMQEEENAKQQREAEAAERAKEKAENGLAVAPSWANAEKIVGRPGEFITPNGLRVKGHYVLVESGAAVPSHDARHGFKQSEGFPTDEKGHTLNDRDYERDLDAQRVQREIARNYDARATQQPVVVSPEGFVLSGNGRTMSGDLAAMENTDGAYNSYVREYAEMWGFTSDQVEKLEHPRVVFVSDNPLPLTTETFAAFNAQETKTQSRTEKAVKMGKAVSDEDFAKILRIVTDGHETLADFYGNMSGVSEVINLLETSGVITQQDRANLFDGDALSDEGRNLLENVLLGKAFEGNPDVVRQLSEVRSLRTSVLNALFYIVENERLNEEFRLSNELSRAINFVYHARKGGGYSFGDKVRTFVQQTELFESTTDVTLDDATVLLLADALNDKRTTLIKSIFKSYNERAEDAGKGQMSLFGDAIPSRETLIMETLALLGADIKDYAPSNQVETSNQATNEQQEPKQQQQPEAGTSESTSEQGVEGKTETKLPSGSVSTSGRGNEGVSTEEEGAKPSDKNAKPSEKSTEKGEKAEDIEVDASAEEESAPLKEEEGINESSRGGSLQDEKEKDKAGYKLTTRRRVVKAKARGGREWIDSLRTTADSHYLRLATDVGYISAPEAQAIIRNSHTKDDVLNLLLRKLEANYFDLYQTDVAEEMARRNLPAEDLQRLYDVVMKDPRAYRFYNALDAIAQNKNTPESVLDELYKRAIKEGRRLDKDGNYVDLGLRLAQNPSTSESHLRTLALTHGEDVAKNPSAPVDLLRVFATEKKSPYGSYYALRTAVAQNPSTPADLLLEILRTSDREEAAVEYAVKHPNLKGTDLEHAAELASNPSIFNNPNVTDELLEKWASVKGETKAVKTFAELAQIELDERRTSKEEEGKAHLTKSQRELLELVRNPNATAEELQRAYEGEYYDKDDAKQVKKAKELAKVREEVVRAVAAHPNASSTVLYEIYYSEGEEDPELQRIIESRKDDTIGEDILGSKPKSRIREQRVGTSDIVVGQTVYFKGQPWKVEAISPNGKLTITTEILGHVLRHENILPRWVRLEPVEEKQSDKELSHANNTVSEEQGDTKSARESDSEALNSIESRDKDYADAVARGDIETAERMLAEEAERKGYSLDSPYQGESAFNGKAPSDSGYYENAEERKKAYDEGDYEGAWTLADELVHGVDVGSLVDFRLSDNELRRANDMTRESILNLREALRKARSGEKNITIKMYRSVPPGVKEREFRNGDWITPSRLYALDNAEIHEGYEGENQEGWNGGYRIIEQEVPIEDVWWDGNDVNEWGYDNGEREAYRNTENNRKTFSVTYDSEGNLIPLSKRFDETNSDARYSKGGEQRVSNENALDGVSPEQIELRDGLVDIMRDAGMDVSVSDAEGQRVLDLARGATIEADAVREAREIERVNAVFNDELDAFSEDNANRIIFSLGRPSEVLRAAGVPDMPMKLYGSKLLKKIKKHGFDKVALRDLPRAVANPIAVFNNRKQEGNRAILTELHTEQGNVLVAIDLGKGADVDFNVVSSVFGKGKNGVVEWINKRQFTYVDEEKALNYLHLAAPIAAASDNQKLSLAANVINGLKKTKLSGENLRQQLKNSITEEMQSIKTKAQSDGTFMLAPNGEPTNLTERQWLQVRTDAFKEWFGDWENDPEEASQMKDENGEPKVFYHNTNADFFAFNPLYNGSSTDAGWLGDGFYFYGDPSEGQGYGEKKMSVFLNIREPYYASEEENRSLSEQNDRSASLKFREERESEGYDGVYFNGDLRQETVVFSPTQIKSATDNVGAFDASKEDIREQRVWHGTPHDFDHFDHSKMGTGEGNQTFGWGTYLTGDKNSGVYYATLRRSSFNPSTPIPIEKSEVLKLGMVLEHRAKVRSAEQALANAIASGTSEDVAVLKEKLEKARKSLRDWVSKVSGDVQAKEKDFQKWREERDKELEHWKENHDTWTAHLMSVEIPDTETHRYLKWDENVPTEELSRINAALEERGYAPLELGADATGELVYEKLGVGTDRENSEFLHDALDYVGIEYPAGSKMTGYEGDEHNYVIFDESDAKIIDKVKLFRGQHGEVRGFAVGGRIYLDPKMASDETAIHEYTHLWADALRRVNPAEWENVKGLLRGTPIWEETKRLYPELADDEDALADEVLAQFSGRHGARRLAEAREKAMSEADGVFDKAKVVSVFDNVRQALKRFWKGVADFLGLHFTNAEEVADKVLSDLLNGVNPNLINHEYENRSENEPAKTDNELIAEQLIQRLRNAGVDVEISERGEEELAAREREYRREVLSSFASQYKTDLLPRNENGFPLFDFDYALRYRDLKMKIDSLKMSIMGDKVALSDIKELKPIWGESRYIEHVLLFRENIEKKELELTDCLQLLKEFDRLNGPELEEYLKKEDWRRVDYEWKEWADRYGVPVNEDQIDTFYIQGSASISDNRIWIRPRSFNANVLVHEYTHLWAAAIRQANPELWERIKELMPDLPEWHEVLSNSGYSTIRNNNDALADEVLAHFSGRHGESKLLEALQKMKEKDSSPASVHLVQQMFSNVRMALQKFWQAVAKLLGMKYESAEDIADKVLADLLNGVNPRNIDSSAYEAPTIREQRIDNDTREEMQRSVDELRVEVREGYEKAVKDWKYKMQEQWQDSMLALKTLQEQLEKQGVKIEEWENAYWAENRMSSMNEEEMKAYTRDYFKPIVAAQIAASKALPQELTDKLNAMDAHLREFDKMDAEEKQRNAVDNYLMLKHGLERNRVLAMRDAIDAQWENPSEASSVWRAYNEDAGNRENRRLLQEGKRSFEEFLQVDDAIRAHYVGEEYLRNREKDYSGLTSMTTEELTELKDVENAALQLVKEAEDAAGAELSALWDKVNKATSESVEKLYKSGLLTPAAYSQMTTMFQWYVPLRGFAEETSDEVYDYVDQRNGNGMGAVLKGADGRKSKADSPIAHIGSMAERSVVQGNRNLMKQHFYRMVMAHPNDLVSMGEIYLHHNEVTDEWEMMTPTHSPNATPEQIAEETRAFEERMQELVRQEPGNYLRLREHPDVPYRVLGSNLGEHQVLVKVLGRDKLLTVNGDPRVAQAVNGRFNPDAAQSLAGKSVRALNRVLAQMATQSNPEFIFRNMFRDRSYAMKASLVKDGTRYWKRLERNWVAGLGQVIGLSKRYENGTLNMNNELDKTFQEFMMNGGATGVTRLLNPEDYKGEITDTAKELQRGKYSVVKLTKLMKKYIEFFGSCSELITRFATYRTSREMGRSVARAVWDAKEISTNFNKKGAGSKALRKDDGLLVRTSGELASFFRNYIIFTNANIQGFHNQWQIAKKHPLRFALNFAVRGLFTGFVMTLANRLLASAFGDDDDRYMDLPESARRSNLCFFVPDLGWVKFPLGFNYRSFYGLGGLMAERVFMPDESYESFMKSALSLALDMLPLSIRDGEQPLWLDLVPSGVRPMAEVAVNEDWSGRPIVNENVNENWSEYRRANNRTSNISIKISEGLNYLTGGDEYTPGFVNLNPSQFEHIALGLLSGVGTLVGNTYETTANLAQGEELDPRHIPFLKDFFSTSGGVTHTSAVKRNFYALKDEYEKTKVRVLGYEREEADGKNDPESVARRVDFTKNSKEYKRYEVMDEAVSEVNSLRKDLKEATTPEEVKALETEMQQVMEDAINDVRAIK